jgi:hypothetical protein
MESQHHLLAVTGQSMLEAIHYGGEEPDEVEIVDSRADGAVHYLFNNVCWNPLQVLGSDADRANSEARFPQPSVLHCSLRSPFVL